MRFFIFDYEQHGCLVDSFLESASKAHKQPIKTIDWFIWKFRDNPFGKTILACVEEDGKIVGCVAYGIQNFILNNKKIKGAISFETFVHPNHQGDGVFSKLLNLAEIRAKEMNIDLFLNFPNSNSLKGFVNKAWKNINIVEYWIRGKSLITIPLKFLDLKKGFIPNPSNIEKLVAPKCFDFESSDVLQSMVTLEYLKWRFFTFPNAEYHYIGNDIYDSICRIGHRGKLKEAQVLFVNIKKPRKFKLSNLQMEFQKKSNYDLISFPISKTNHLRKKLKRNLFIKVPNSTNVCFKILDGIITEHDMQKVSLSAINFHTY
jgi:GNAT superfamily N-acetyltransferase